MWSREHVLGPESGLQTKDCSLGLEELGLGLGVGLALLVSAVCNVRCIGVTSVRQEEAIAPSSCNCVLVSSVRPWLHVK